MVFLGLIYEPIIIWGFYHGDEYITSVPDKKLEVVGRKRFDGSY
jgi:hypothetical protein